MKGFYAKRSTEELLSLGMALRADRETMETRIRGIFSRKKSSRFAAVTALVLALAMAVGCFTTACRPVTAEQGTSVVETEPAKPAAEAPDREAAGEEAVKPLLTFAGPATATLDGNTVLVTSADGQQTVFTVVDDGIAEYSQPFDGLDVVTPQQAAMEAARVAVTLWGDQVADSEIHVMGQKYAEPDTSMAYYEIGMGGKSWSEGSGANGLVDAATGTLLSFDANEWGKNSAKYGSGFINEKIRTWEWDSEAYGEVHTSEKAMATAVELIEKCFPTGTILPCVTKDGPDWDAVSYTDGEQIAWSGGYMALVDVYLRMDKDPCYYARIGVPLEEGAEPSLEIFSCYPLGWEYCKEGTWDPAQLAMLQEEYRQIRETGEYQGADGYARSYSVFDEEALNNAADAAVRLIGQKFFLAEDIERSYGAEFIEEQGNERIVSMAFVDVSMGLADPWTVQWLDLETPEKVARCALRGQTLEFPMTGLWAVYIGDGQCVYAEAEPDSRNGIITQESVENMMQHGSCHLQINDYMVVSPAVEAMLDSSEAQVTQGFTGETLMPRPTPVPDPVG